MTRALYLTACVAIALVSRGSATMREQDQQIQQAQQDQQSQQSYQQLNGQSVSNLQMADSEGEQGGSSMVGSGGSATVIIIAVNAGGNSETQQMNAAVQPPMATHTVTVGGSAGLIYSPDNVKANKYDMVQFNFMSKNHTVTQSTFPKPCSKMPAMAGMPNPIDSGFMPFNGTGKPPTMMVQVTSTSTPMWFYCRQKNHCGAGMTFSINPNQPGQGSKTQAAFKAAAIQQNGTVAMGAAAASGAVPPSAPPATPAVPPASSMANMGAAASNAAQSLNQAGSINAMMAQGTGQTGTGGACACSCLCGAAAFPNSMQGLGAMGGGIPGAIPAVGAGMKFKT